MHHDSFSRTPGSRQPSPSEEDHLNKSSALVEMAKLAKPEDLMQSQVPVLSQQALSFDHHMEPVAIDPMSFDYSSHIIQSIDSPTFLDYAHNQVTIQLKRQLFFHQSKFRMVSRDFKNLAFYYM